MNGIDFLKKLENLDPKLIAAAAEPPEPKVRRGPDWGVWAAAAACIAAVCLPLALMYLVHGIVPTIEPRGGPGAGSASHQASVDTAGDEGVAGGNGISPAPTPQVSQSSYGNYRWTQYTLNEEHCAAYPDGLPAEEYFKYNVQGLGNVEEMWEYSDYDSELDNVIETGTAPQQWEDEFTSQLPDNGADYTVLKPVLSGPQSGPARARLRAFRADSEEGGTQDNALFVDVCAEPLVDEEDFSRIRTVTNQTTAALSRNKIVFAMGGLDSSRVLCASLPNSLLWCHVVGGKDVPPEDMAAVLDWLLTEPELLAGISAGPGDEGSTDYADDYTEPHYVDMDSLKEDLPPEIIPYIPYYDTNDYVPQITDYGTGRSGTVGQPRNEMHVGSIELYYEWDQDGRPLELFKLKELANMEEQDSGIGDLYALTLDRSVMDSQYRFQRRIMPSDIPYDRIKEDIHEHYEFSFTWDGYYVTATFNDSLTADQLWGFLNQLVGKEQPTAAKAQDQAMADAEAEAERAAELEARRIELLDRLAAKSQEKWAARFSGN